MTDQLSRASATGGLSGIPATELAGVLPATHEAPPPSDSRLKYRFLYDALAERLERLPAGASLPTERELCVAYGVSRPTVRRALKQLEAEQRIYRRQGRGTFVSRPKIDLTLQLTSLSEDMRAHGVTPGAKLIDVSRVKASAEIAAKLGLDEGAEVFRVERLRLADGEPVATEALFVSAVRFDGISAALGLGKSFYRLLHTDYGVELASAEETIEAVAADPREAELLGIPAGVPVLKLSRRTVDTSGRPTEYVRSFYRADRFRFRSVLERPITARQARDGAPPLRLATDADAREIATVFVSAWQAAYPGIVDERILASLDVAEITTWIRGLMRAPNQATLAAVGPDGTIIGFTRFGEDPEDSRRGQIYSLYVAPEAARQGVGGTLLERALDALTEHNLPVVTLWVFEANAPALALYRSFGFRPDGARRVEPQYGAPEVRLLRDAAQPVRDTPVGASHRA